jgi:fructokinase
MDTTKTYYAGIEAGGTKFNCAIARGPDDVLAASRILTTDPKSTLNEVTQFFTQHRDIQIESVGIACFGPLDLNPQSETYGYITSTPKQGWENTDIRSTFSRAMSLPVFIDTDVNGAALGEYLWGAGKELDTFIYLTIGTGIGGGGLVNGKLMHGLVHPEMGHILIPHDVNIDPFPGNCPFHKDCFEGLASGPAIEERWGASAESLPADHPAWELEANYLGLALANFIVTLSPKRIILGGGVLQHPGLIEKVRDKVKESLNEYVKSPQIITDIDTYIVLPQLGNRAGIMGAIALAMQGSEGINQSSQV